MKIYSAKDADSPAKTVRDFAEAARRQGEWLYATMGSIGLIADPRPIDPPNYTEQLLWTYDMVLDPETRAFFGARSFYQNLVPEIQAQAILLKQQFTRTFWSDDLEAQMRLLRNLVPVTWCEWAWSNKDSEQLVKMLTESDVVSREVLVYDARTFLDHMKHLNAQWGQAAHTWLMTQHD